MPNKVRDNAESSRYELEVSGQTVFADYRKEEGKIYILHVEAPVSLRGTGAAGKLMQGMMEQLRLQKVEIVPVCGYAVAWIRRHAG